MSDRRVIAGIDIGSSKICTIIGQIGEDVGDAITILGVSTVPSKGMRKGQVVDIVQAESAALDGLESAQRMAGYQLSSAYVSVGGAHILSQNSHAVVAVSHTDAEIIQEDVDRVSDAAKAITIPSSREIIHVIPRMFIVDGQDGIKDPVGMTGVRLEIETHIVHGSVTSVRNLTRCVNDMKLDVESFVFSGVASACAVLTETEKELGVAVVDIGGGTTDISMYIDGALSHSVVLPIGSKNITNDIAIGLRISLDTAEQIKILLSNDPRLLSEPLESQHRAFDRDARKKADEIDLSMFNLGDDLKSVSRKLLLDGIIRPRLEELFTHVAIEFKKSGFQTSIPAGVVVCGGGAQTVGLVDVCKRVTGLPTRIGTPHHIDGLIDELQNPAYTTAVGLLLYGANEGVRQQESRGFSIPKVSGLSQLGSSGDVVQKVYKWIKSFLP
ncbi:MAG: cell division protein FtsA [bacterium]|nr:cell division protein FtsA [bacterium]